MAKKHPAHTRDLINRGDKSPNAIGTATFVGVRAVDPFIQYGILAHGPGSVLIKKLGLTTVANGPLSNTGSAALDGLKLSPYRLVLLAMSVGAAAKHVIWKIAIGEEQMGAGAAVSVGIFNTLFNSVNGLLFICAATSPAYGHGEGPHWRGWPSTPLLIGSALFATGIAVELVAELQRAAFKNRKENKGKPYTGGLFAFARHINYGGYTVWRAGYALAAGGWVWGALTAAFFTWDFSSRAIPSMDAYCNDRYADLWHDYRNQTRAKLFPGVY